MDRLICGDVGYGKTEVALRAAFKAVEDGKQVMFLVPDDRARPAALRHLHRAHARLPGAHRGGLALPLADGDARGARATSPTGKVDIMIGTHRLLSRDVRPKDLGLLIVDEEQRFGVKQKELLRQLRLRVDVLSLSATPIPRTLQMSLAGPARHLGDRDAAGGPPAGEDLRGRLRRGARRRGDRARARARGARPSSCTTAWTRSTRPPSACARWCRRRASPVAHGQMAEGELEQVMLDFLRGEADVLVCTTIVESGLDIPSANTLIVERADELGLAQLYQIRGRVGRSRERAYAYLLYPSAAALSEEAAQRLSTLSDYTELGSGFKIAMRDLEIRGAGNLLGADQSGHVAAVGFELYMGMLDEAVRLLSGDSAEEAAEPVRMDLPVDAYVPGDYVPVRGGEDRAAPARGGRARDRRPDPAARGARGPLRAGAGAARQPDQAPGRAHQARPRGRADGGLRRRAARGGADRARLARGEGPARARSRRRSTSRAAARCGSACPRRPPSASRPWWRRPRRSSRWPPRPTLVIGALLPFRTAQGA